MEIVVEWLVCLNPQQRTHASFAPTRKLTMYINSTMPTAYSKPDIGHKEHEKTSTEWKNNDSERIVSRRETKITIFTTTKKEKENIVTEKPLICHDSTIDKW